MMDSGMFDEAIGEVPPSTVDVDAAMARGRRAARVRAVVNPVVGVGVAVVLLVAGAGAFPQRERGGSELQVAASPTASAPADRPRRCDSFEMSLGGSEPHQDVRARLTMLVRPLVQQQLPDGATLVPSAASVDRYGARYEPLEFFGNYDPAREAPTFNWCEVSYFYYAAHADILRDGRFGSVSISVSVEPASRMECGGVPDDRTQTFCRVFEVPGGEEVFAHSEEYIDGVRQHSVVVAKAEGTTIHLTAFNRASDGNRPRFPEPPLNVDELRGIALDARMILFR
ncbi:hypothetical protein [Actinophytocola xanthii]|uniref:Uncharacterized protein n=1 Tax=Actinophytocola xanthii TaxID=1912961 RepID=A0A1Q8CNS3_9PSEU|nr:hypothetical protein [Actinophytocola xanthii]OLF16007.1 hypothetical protein BU204_19115 [Actinophytocola xanthii]